ncbi:hypothetical protein RHMOL_Rhmol13G0081600 [Rhododendron molle]|uniref:Uncharacterized protein n=1 Tax=Rhododendron molle TaxID=49168 RepID=A0ACC0L572_RHOML|nr:hypothetical protein RHMOL_Rhmol13G0081600 [Rhododendron molle]
MWLPRENPAVRIRTAPSKNFSCSSFKDIQHLCSDDFDSPQQPPHLADSPRVSSVFRRVRLVDSLLRTWSTRLPTQTQTQSQSHPSISLPGAEHLIIVYHTSLHVVRSTFEDCRAVRSILRGFKVSIDERDVSMDSKFVDELRGIFGSYNKGRVSLPRVFIGGRYVGGAEEVRRMHESGELKKLVRGLPAAAAEHGACELCGGYRFILCDECSGSHKCYYSEKGGFRTCTACNENGLIRCPSCSCAVPCTV